MRQLALHVRFPTNRTNPCGADHSGRLQSFGAARPWLRLSLGLEPTVRNYTNTSSHRQFCTSRHRHKHHPITHRHGRGPGKCMFLLASYRNTHPSREHPSAWPNLCATQAVMVDDNGELYMICESCNKLTQGDRKDPKVNGSSGHVWLV